MALYDRISYGMHAWNWDLIADVLPRGLCPGDADGIVVLSNGFFAIFEGKRADATCPPPIRKGQFIAFKTLSRVGNCTIFIVGGDNRSGEIYWLRVMGPFGDTGWRRANLEEFRRLVWQWGEKYSKLPPFWEARRENDFATWSW